MAARSPTDRSSCTIMARLAFSAALLAAVAAAEPKVTNKAEIQRLNSRDLPAVPTIRCARGATRINSVVNADTSTRAAREASMGINSSDKRGHTTHAPRAGLFRHLHRRRPGRKSGDGPLRRRRAQDRRELPRALHGREGRGQERQAAPLQGLQVPPRHPELYVAGRSATQRLAAMAPS